MSSFTDGRRPDRAIIDGETSDVLVEAKEAFKVAVESEADNRLRWREDLKFSRLGDQWDPEVLERRKADQRPALIVNKMPRFIRQVTNEARKNRSSIKVKPVDSQADPETAEVFNGLIRNIEAISDADVAYDNGIDYAASMGIGFWRVSIDYAYDDVFEQDLLIESVPNPFSVYGDPYDRGHDSANWNSAFVVENMPHKEFERRWKGAAPVDWDTAGYSRLGLPWFSDKSVLVAEWWKREERPITIWLMSDQTVMRDEDLNRPTEMGVPRGAILASMGIEPMQSRESKTFEVTQYMLTGAELLEEPTDWPGKYIPIVPVYGEDVNVEGDRYLRSLIADAKDPQRMHNYWRTATTEMVALAPKAPWIGTEGAFAGKDAHKWSNVNRSNYSYLSVPDGFEPPQRLPLGKDIPIGAWAEAEAADEDMRSVLGLEKPVMGEPDNERSGRAILQRKKQGETQTFHFPDNQARAIRHTGRILIDLIPHVYTGPRIIRTLGPDDKERPCRLGDPGCGRQQGEMNPQDGGYQLNGVYDLTAGKYDLLVKAGPSYATQREEAAEQMLALVEAYPAAAPVIGDLIAKNLDWPGAEEIAERLRAINPALQQQQPDPRMAMMQQYIGQLEQQIKEMSLDQQVDIMKAMNDAANTRIKEYDAETKRISALTDAGEAIVSAANPPGPYDPHQRRNGSAG